MTLNELEWTWKAAVNTALLQQNTNTEQVQQTLFGVPYTLGEHSV